VYSVCKEYAFEAAHHLPNHKGACKNQHGHSYKVEVKLSSFELNNTDGSSPSYGMLMDFHDIDDIVKPIINKLDHSNLNESGIPLVSAHPTSEIIASWLMDVIRYRVQEEHPHIWVGRIRVWETAKCYAEVVKFPPRKWRTE